MLALKIVQQFEAAGLKSGCIGCTFVESTAELCVAVTLVLTDAAWLSLGGVLRALAPHTQLA